ncbi:MAG: ATPase, T2SS/T4P/T4SS family [Nitrospinota bacterium]
MDDNKPKKQIGELLKEKGLIRNEHIAFAILEQKITKERLGEVLERLGFITQYDVVTTLAEQVNVPYLDLDEVLAKDEALKLFNKNLCINNAFLPIRVKDGKIDVASSSGNSANIAQLITRQTGLIPNFYLSEQRKVINAIHKFYHFMENPIEKMIETEVRILTQDTDMARGMDNLFKYILQLGVKMRATDIHIRPMEKSISIAFRVDGVMVPVLTLPPALNRIVSSIKMKADMDIAEQRLPQDGRFSASILNNEYDFRASTIVTPYGENMVMRVLPMETSIMSMTQLGFFSDDVQKVHTMFNEPFGIILLTGPTGSGKSTTLYAGIRSLDLLKENVLTVEDPIEYSLPILRQTQVNEKAGYNFSNAIRYFLRHDPDVILVGEIRDGDTASTAITASSTGHMVLSTLHTNNAIGAIPRLRDLGVKSFMIADSLIGVISQRLVRLICQHCKEEYIPEKWEREYLQDDSIKKLWRGKGCEVCNGTGYFGRTLVYELLSVDKELSTMIDSEVELGHITARAKEKGFMDIFSVTVRKVKMGITSTEEALRTLGHIF